MLPEYIPPLCVVHYGEWIESTETTGFGLNEDFLKILIFCVMLIGALVSGLPNVVKDNKNQGAMCSWCNKLT